ncbi:unnamed protein product [Prunus brigantina]
MLDLCNRDGYADEATYHAFGGEINPSLLKLKYLNLSSASFGGIIPLNLGNLSRLIYLDLGNDFGHPIETDLQWLATLSSLKYLNLEGVNLAKTTSYWLPTVNMLPSLVELHLPFCRPPMLPLSKKSRSLGNLALLDLSNNKFTSTIPPWLFNLTELEIYFDLSYNSLQGSIPKSIGNLTSLEEFDLAWNQMSGIIPESLGELLSLVSLDIYGSTWEGAITEAHFAKLGGLRRVSIENNSLNISLVFNISSDWIPPFKLRSLHIRSCQLGPKFPTWLRNQTELTTVALNNARISNTILDWFLQLDLQLDFLDVSYNQLSGTVPNSLRFSFYSVVDLSSNRYEGPLPLWSSNITMLFLRDNLFSGPIPHNISQVLPNLTHLDISRNFLSGSIPHFWNNIPSLYIVDMSNNISGTIPRSLGSLTSLRVFFLYSNNFSGEVPFLKNCSDMKILDLGDNKFFGPIPAFIGESMLSLKILRLRSNSFTGSIPLQLCGLSTLHILDFSHNNLSGNIPHCIGNLSGLKFEFTDRYRSLWSRGKVGGGVKRKNA